MFVILSKLHVPAFVSEDWQACREAIQSTDLPPGKKNRKLTKVKKSHTM